ncbi:MAG: hypothetical protein P0S93_01265 [Candidatus Neptunochlamydia sp.]|nr:hypothetical protein [Candidatus Neptunochlamydia sp.]
MINPLGQLGKWNVNGETVTLFREQNTLGYFKGEDRSQSSFICPDLINIYGIKRAEKIIDIFHNVIQVNLEERVHSQSFLPLLLTEGYKPIESRETVYYKPQATKQVALFAQHQHGFRKKRVFNKRWAVLNLANREVTVYQVETTNKEAMIS